MTAVDSAFLLRVVPARARHPADGDRHPTRVGVRLGGACGWGSVLGWGHSGDSLCVLFWENAVVVLASPNGGEIDCEIARELMCYCCRIFSGPPLCTGSCGNVSF